MQPRPYKQELNSFFIEVTLPKEIKSDLKEKMKHLKLALKKLDANFRYRYDIIIK